MTSVVRKILTESRKDKLSGEEVGRGRLKGIGE